MDQRLILHEILRSISNNVYFQPPENLKISYPCIIYQIEADNTRYANDKKYIRKYRYNLTIIDRNPDSELLKKVLDLDYTSFDRHFVIDSLHHYSITLYY